MVYSAVNSGLIAATARVHDLTLITSDSGIRKSRAGSHSLVS